MSKFKPTESQQVFLDTFNKNTLVSASAGSGKTSTMINKLTDLIVDKKVNIKNLLVVTYTNSAGNEMKQKLFNALIEELQTCEDNETIDFISQQIDEMANCDIGTLHAVCKKIVTNYFYVVGQDPTFSLLNEHESSYLFENSMTKVFNELISKNDEKFYSVYKLFNKKRNLSNLKYVVEVLHNYLCSKVDADEWKEYVVETCSKGAPAEKYLFEYFKHELSEFEEILKQFKNVCARDFEQYLDYVGDKLNFVLHTNKIEDYKQFVNFINHYEFLKKPRIYQNKLDAQELEVCEEVDLCMVDFNDVLKQIKKTCTIMSESAYCDYQELISKLFDFVDMVEKEYVHAKKMQNSLDFSDLEHITLEILKDEKIVESLKNKYEYIFVDEYQDINQVQETIIGKIKRESNLYMIGDVKQSIYAFRLSSPEIFIEKFNRFSKETDENKLICLNENFRSEKSILEFSNMVFNSLITEKTIGINYKENSQLVAGKKGEFTSCVTMDILDDESEQSEAVLIANKVGELVKNGFNYSDIAILLRSKGDVVGEIYSELKKYNIPCEATYRTDLFKNNEVLVLYYLLKLVDNRNNDLAMATTLKSLFVGLNDDELAEIRLIDRDCSYVDCVFKYLKDGANEHIKSKISELINLIERLRFIQNNKPILDVVEWLLNEYDVLNYYLSFVDGIEKVGNIREFLNLLSNSEFRYDLKKCLDFLDSVKKDGDVSITVSGVSNSVKIMTIHSSKGLEFPAVILGGIGKNFVLNKQTDDIIINDSLGVGTRMFDVVNHTQEDSLIKLACKIKNKKSEIDEEIRLLYVALTRAKSRLCIVGKCETKNIVRNSQKNIYKSRNYFELMCKALPRESLHFFENKVEEFTINSGCFSEFNVKVFENLQTIESEERDIVLDVKDEDVEGELNKYFNYSYPYLLNNNIALKNSVSQILKEEQDYENNTDSIIKKSNLDDYSLRLGTAYHSIMQNLNYSENLAEIKSLIESIKTSDLPYEDVNPEKIMTAVRNVCSLFSDGFKIQKETDFVMKVNYGKLTGGDEDVDVLIQGVIDLVVINGNSAIIVDFKTNKTKNEQQLVDYYGLQLKMYADAFEKASKLKVERKLLYSFEMDKFIEVD